MFSLAFIITFTITNVIGAYLCYLCLTKSRSPEMDRKVINLFILSMIGIILSYFTLIFFH
jgi:small neutral amino acid transporter SnatA (MarC family)